MQRRTYAAAAALFIAACVPLIASTQPFATWLLHLPFELDRQLLSMMIFSMLALALHLQVGLAGLMQLGLAAPFALGAFGTGILTVEKFPFQLGFWGALVLVPPSVAVLGLVLGLPAALLSGDYVAMVTLGTGEVVRVVLLNLEAITDGSRGLNPLPPPWLPPAWVGHLGTLAQDRLAFAAIYWSALVALVVVYLALGALERRPMGRALVALRADALACASLGYEPIRLRLLALAVGSGIAGLAGVLYATYLTTTAEPNTYDFNVSVMLLCAVIVGGLGSRAGAVLGAAALVCFDNVLSPLVTQSLALMFQVDSGSTLGTFSNWRWLLFGTALVATMRLRPQGLWPRVEPGPCDPKVGQAA